MILAFFHHNLFPWALAVHISVIFFSRNKIMPNCLVNRSLMFNFVLFVLQVPFYARATPMDHITSCLKLHNINNFTSFSNLRNGSHCSTYHQLLEFSIQNLRFTDSTLPKPAAIILPESRKQLVNAVLCSKEVSWNIKLRCGGHSYEGTSSVADGGDPFVIIDMMNLNRVWVDMKTETAWLEGGATLGETYYAIAESSELHGFSAGSCSTVGVGGHIGGGGFGLLSRKYGLAADNVVDALLVDANGRVLNRKGMGEDVFWAIRGGGGGVWGIVYAWQIQLLKVPQTVTGCIASRVGGKSKIAMLVNKWQYVAPNLEADFYLSCFVGAALPEAKLAGVSATFKGFFLGPRIEAISTINQAFPELGVVDEECKEMSWIESVLFFSGLKHGSTVDDLKTRSLLDKKYFKAKSDYVRTPMPIKGIRTVLDILEEQPRGYIILDPYGGIMDNISIESIAFPHRKGNLFIIQYLVEWDADSNQYKNKYVSWIRQLYGNMTAFVSSGPRAAYVNYVDFDLGMEEFVNKTSVQSDDAVEAARVWGEKYFLNNYDRLVTAKTLIDPDNIFRNQQSIPPKYPVSFTAV